MKGLRGLIELGANCTLDLLHFDGAAAGQFIAAILAKGVAMELFYVAFWGVLTVGGAMIGMLMLVITIYVLTR